MQRPKSLKPFNTSHFFFSLFLLFLLSLAPLQAAFADPSISLTKSTTTPSFDEPNQTLNYSYLITNTGTETLDNISITDNMISSTGITCLVTTLAPNASTTCSGMYTTVWADLDAGNVTNTATASGSAPDTTVVTSTPSTVIVNAILNPSLGLIKSTTSTNFTAAGQSIVYNYLVKNTGNDTINSIAITDSLIPTADITCPQTTLVPDASTTCTGTYITTQADVDAGGVTNSATATGQNNQGTPAVNDCLTRNNSSCDVTVPALQQPDIDLVKSSATTSFNATGVTITYNYLVTNTGNDTLHAIAIVDNKVPLANITCPITTLAPATSTTCTGTYTTTLADINTGGVTNIAIASGRDPANTLVVSLDTLMIPAVQQPALSLVKSTTTTSFSTPGVTINYSYLVTNTGNDTLNTIAVTDTKIPASHIMCTVTTLLPGASTTCTAAYLTTQADVDAGEIANTGTVSGKNNQGTTVNATSSVIVNGIQSPSVSLTKSSATGSYNAAGQNISYSYAVKNTGNQTLNTVGISDNKVSSAITCLATILAPNASTTCTGTYVTTQADVDAGSITNIATAAGQNNQGTIVNSAPSSTMVFAILTPGITLVKSSSAPPFNSVGQVINYNYLITNTGNETLSNIVITDNKIPAVSITCPVTSLAPTASTTCTATHTTTQADIDAGGVTNTATVTGQTPSGRLFRSTASTVTVPAIQEPSISMVKSSPTVNFDGVNQTINYSYLVTNTGNDTLNTITIVDDKVASNLINCLATTLAPGASTTCTAIYTTTLADVDAGGITNIATAEGTNGVGDTVSSAVSTITIPAIPEPALMVTKSTTTSLFNGPNQTISYSYLVKNTGNDTISTIAIADNKVSTPITCLTTVLAPNTSTTCTATYITTQADVDAGSVNNSATASGQNSQAQPVISAPSTVTVPAMRMDAVNLTKTSNPTSFTIAGTLITYSYLVENMGNTTLTSISIADPHAGLSVISCPVTTLAPNDSTTCTATYTTTVADMDAGFINNTAVISANSSIGMVHDAASLTIPGVQAPAMTISKAANVGSFSVAGSTITYYYLVTNTGNVTLNTITVTDPHSGLSAITCPVTSLAPGGQTTCTATYVTTSADVSAGNITNTGSVSATSPAGNTNATSNTLVIPFQGGANLASIAMTKSADVSNYSAPGTTITYSYLVENTGQVTLNINVTDPHPGLSSISCPTTTLVAGAQTTCTATYTTTQGDVDAGVIFNTGTASAGSNFEAISSVTILGTQTPSISLAKLPLTANFNAPSQILSYQYLVTNTGNQTLQNINITDDKIASVNITCLVTTLAPGATTTCTGSYETTQADVDAGGVSNTALVSAQSPQGTTVNAGSTVTVPAIPAPAISITKSTTTTSFSAPGQTLLYDYLVKNTGNDTLNSITIADDKVPLATITCLTTTLAPNLSTTCTGSYITTQADVDAGNVVNNSTASGVNLQGTPVTSAVSTVIVYATLTPGLTLTKTTPTTSFNAPGQNIAYNYVVTNNGNDTISNIAISDNKVPTVNITCLATALAPNASTTCTATYVTTQGDVDAAGVTNTATATGMNPQGTFVRSPVASTTVDAIVSPAITLVKSTTTLNFNAPNQLINYSYLVTNTGNDTLNSISILDSKVATNQISCLATVLAPGASTTCTAMYETIQADVDAGGVTNTATATSLNPQGTPVDSAPSSVTVVAILTPGIMLQKSTTATTFTAAGESIPYEYLVKNTGNDTLNAIAIADNVIPSANITCPVTTLAPNASTTCTAIYITTQADIDAGVLTNTAAASGQNNQLTTVSSGPSSVTLIPVQLPAITVVKSSNTPNFNGNGQTISYNYLVTNTGNDTLNTIAITDNKILAANITCPVTTLAPGVSTTCTGTYITTQADVDGGGVTNTASASGKNAQGTTVSSSPSTVTVPAIQEPSITLVKSTTTANFTNAGDSIHYQYLVENTGNDTLSNIVIADDTVVTSINCLSTTLAPHATTTCTATYPATQADVDAGSVTNTATASGKNTQGTTVISPTSSVTVNAILEPEINMIKSTTTPSYTAPGQTLHYTYSVKNTGNDTLSNITIADDKVTTGITCVATTLAPDASTTCTGSYVTTQADVDAGSVINVSTSSGTNPQGTTVTSPISDVTVFAILSPALSLTKSSTTPSFNGPNQTINYSYQVTNTGNSTLNTISINDDKMSTPITCLATVLAPGASTTCTGSYTTTQADVDAGSVTNIATASGQNAQGTLVNSPPDSVTVDAVLTPSLSLTKSSITTSFNGPNQTLDYSYLVTNTGNDTLNTIAIADDKVATVDITCLATTLAPGASTTCTGSYTTTQADVDAGSVTNTATASGQNNQGTEVTSGESSVTINAVLTPALSLLKTTSTPNFTMPGQNIDYSYLVTNTGNDTINSIVITDNKVATVNITCAATTLAPGASTTCTGSYTTTQADVDLGRVTNTATASGQNPQGDPVSSEDSSVTVNALLTPSISLVKSTTTTTFNMPGQSINYSYLVTNTGNQTLTGIAITDDKLTSGITCLATTLAPNAITTCTGTYITTQADVDAGGVTNHAFSSGVTPQGGIILSDCSINNNSNAAAASVCTTTVPAAQAPAISLTKTTTTASYSGPGEPLNYVYHVMNTGNDTLINIAVTDDKVPTANITCLATSLTPGATTTCTGVYLTTQADVDAGSVTNIATVAGMTSLGAMVESDPSSVTIIFIEGAGSITLVKSASIENFVFPGTPITYTYLVTNTGETILHDVLVTDSKLGAIVCPSTVLAVGTSMTCTANYVTTMADVDAGGVTNVGTATGLTPNDSVVTSDSTLTVGLNSELIRQKTLSAIRDYLNDRAQLVLAAEPDRRRILNRLSEDNKRYCKVTENWKIQPSPTGDAGTVDASASINELCYEPSKLDVWIEAHGAYYNRHNLQFTRRGQFGVAYVGVDYLFTPAILAGVLTQADTIHQSGAGVGVGSAHGQGWLVGPYLSTRLKPDLYLHTRAAWGGSTNKINVFGLYNDSFRTTRSLYNAELIGDWFHNSLRISPTVGISYYSELQRNFTNTIGVFIPSQRVNLGQVNVGPEVAYLFEPINDREISLRLSLQALYNFNQNNNLLFEEDVLPVARFSGRVKLGAEVRLPSGSSLTPMITYDGIGDNIFRAAQVQLQVNVPLG